MEEKKWYQSKTMWAGVVALIVGAARALGIADLTGEQAAIVEMILNVLTILAGTGALYGRAKASTAIAPIRNKTAAFLLLCSLLTMGGCSSGDVKAAMVIEGQPAPFSGYNIGPDIYVQEGQPVKLTGAVIWIKGLEPGVLEEAQ